MSMTTQDESDSFDAAYRVAKQLYAKLEPYSAIQRVAIVNLVSEMADYDAAKEEELDDRDGEEWKERA